jgi:acetolactate synthase-1/2/3 large subunit
VRYGVPILVVVLRNGMHGTIAMHQTRELGRTAGTGIGGWTSPRMPGAWAP